MRIEISGIWNKYKDKEIESDQEIFEQARNEICNALKKYNDKILKIFGEDILYEYEEIIEQLEYSENLEEFNNFWNDFYDFCDAYRIWMYVYR